MLPAPARRAKGAHGLPAATFASTARRGAPPTSRSRSRCMSSMPSCTSPRERAFTGSWMRMTTGVPATRSDAAGNRSWSHRYAPAATSKTTSPIAARRRKARLIATRGSAARRARGGGRRRWRGAQLAEDAAHVLLDGVLGDEQSLADRAVGAALGHQPEHVELALGQLVERVGALAGARRRAG